MGREENRKDGPYPGEIRLGKLRASKSLKLGLVLHFPFLTWKLVDLDSTKDSGKGLQSLWT